MLSGVVLARMHPRQTRCCHLNLCGSGHSIQTVSCITPGGPADATRRLAALEACSECPLQLLELQGAVPLSGAVAEAVAACCPHLSNLVLDHQRLSRPSDAVPARGAVAEYDYGCGQLLTLCGPRLRGLTLLGVHHWKALSYMALRRCTALTSLALDAGGIQFETGRCERFLGGCLGLRGKTGGVRMHRSRSRLKAVTDLPYTHWFGRP